MGLFSKKAPCPICGNKISWFLPTKIEGEYICDTCSSKIDMSEESRAQLTMQGFQEYLMFYHENQALKDRFVISEKLDFGFFDTKIIFDYTNRLFCMSGSPEKTIFEGAQLKSFTVKEDQALLFAGSTQGLVRYPSAIPERVAALAPQIQMMVATQRMADHMERLQDDDDRHNTYRPMLDIPEPFRQFFVELHVDHPYWSTIRCDMSAPTFSNQYPDIQDYMQEYQRDVEVMELLAMALMQVAFPGAGESIVGQAAVAAFSAAPTSPPLAERTAEDILKFKSLLDAGVITREEFDAKKKQLLGI